MGKSRGKGHGWESCGSRRRVEKGGETNGKDQGEERQGMVSPILNLEIDVKILVLMNVGRRGRSRWIKPMRWQSRNEPITLQQGQKFDETNEWG